MNDIEKEAAAWRLWYHVKVNGPIPPESAWKNAGLTEEQYEAAHPWLMALGAIKVVTRRNDNTWFAEGDNEPALIPTAGKLSAVGHTPEIPLDKEHHNAPKDANDDPVFDS